MASSLGIVSCWLIALGGAASAGGSQDDLAVSQHWRWFGRAVIGMGDLDGDCAGDFLVSVPREQAVDGAAQGRCVRAFSGATGALLYARSGPGGFGDSLATLGDVDGDGYPDFAAGWGGGGTGPGMSVCSGVDGRVLYSRTDESWWGAVRVSAVADVTGDGVDDLVCGWPNDSSCEVAGSAQSRVEVLNGATGELVTAIEGEVLPLDDESAIVTRIGRRVWGLGDLDGDGRGEIAFSTSESQLDRAAGSFGVAEGSAAIRVVRGVDGKPLFTIAPKRSCRDRGLSLAATVDWDGDGHPDLAVGSGVTGYDLSQIHSAGMFRASWTSPPGEVAIHSGLDGRPLHRLEASEPTPRFGHALAGGADFDGDGVADLLVSDYGWFAWYGSCTVFSGSDGSVLLHNENPGTTDYGESVTVLEDVNCDGVPDYAVGALEDDPMWRQPGTVSVHSGKTGEELYRLPHED